MEGRGGQPGQEGTSGHDGCVHSWLSGWLHVKCQNASFVLPTTAITTSSISITAAAISVSFKLRAFPWKLHFRISQVFQILASQNVVPVVWDHRSVSREPVKNTGSQASPQIHKIATCISARSMIDSYMNFCLRSTQITIFWSVGLVIHTTSFQRSQPRI